MTTSTAPPNDIQLLEPWFNPIRRWRMAAPPNGLAILSINIIIDSTGRPLKPYPAPTVRVLEPRACAEDALADLLDALVDGSGEE